jgi:hypothetical protein
MSLAFAITFGISRRDARTLRDVGVWVKPMKFMASTALFCWSTVWLAVIGSDLASHSQAFHQIAVLVIVTSLFEVTYITYQASQAAPSHYNTADSWHAFMLGLMAIAAVGLTASQAWLAWEILQARDMVVPTVTQWGVITGLIFTFLLSTISGFLLGGNQPPAGIGLPLVGWHLQKDIRPSHFLGVHAQQFIPAWGFLSAQFPSDYSYQGFAAGCALYLVLWAYLTWRGVRT